MIRIEQKNSGFSMMPDLTALLDIIFIVLVFLLLTANSRVYQMKMNLPQTEQAQPQAAKQPAELQLSLFAESPKWGLGQQRYQNFQTFAAALKQQSQQQPLANTSLASERQVPVEQLLKLLELLQQLKIETTQILMEKKHD
ncbi:MULTISPECIES: ExbD/TolR family protein [unclassified Agarivorans]|uniref:ExbD/TolR family protein n=1 Tax=unclassified Agarivorans TaxID=2636026 RepID=UPI003D7E5EA7